MSIILSDTYLKKELYCEAVEHMDGVQSLGPDRSLASSPGSTPLRSCVTFGTLLHLPGPQFCHRWRELITGMLNLSEAWGMVSSVQHSGSVSVVWLGKDGARNVSAVGPVCWCVLWPQGRCWEPRGTKIGAPEPRLMLVGADLPFQGYLCSGGFWRVLANFVVLGMWAVVCG